MSVHVRKGGELQTQDLGEGVIPAIMMTLVSITLHNPSLLPAATVPVATWQPHDVTDCIRSVPLSVNAAAEKESSSNLVI